MKCPTVYRTGSTRLGGKSFLALSEAFIHCLTNRVDYHVGLARNQTAGWPGLCLAMTNAIFYHLLYHTILESRQEEPVLNEDPTESTPEM